MVYFGVSLKGRRHLNTHMFKHIIHYMHVCANTPCVPYDSVSDVEIGKSRAERWKGARAVGEKTPEDEMESRIEKADAY